MTKSSLRERPTLRQRQSAAVRSDIVKAAIKRFLEKGFDETTVDEIAEDAAVSRSTVFRHFPTKEDIVLSWSMASADRLRSAVSAYPIDGKPPLACLRATMIDHFTASAERRSVPFTLAKLIQRTPKLRARNLEISAQWEEALTEGLIARDPDQAETAEIVVAVGMAAARLGTRRWLAADGSMSLTDCINRAFDELALIGL